MGKVMQELNEKQLRQIVGGDSDPGNIYKPNDPTNYTSQIEEYLDELSGWDTPEVSSGFGG